MKIRFAVFPLEESPGYVIAKTARMLRGHLLRRFRKHNIPLTTDQWAVLNTLWECDGLYPSKLAARIEKDRHSMTRILQVMEKHEMVRKEPDRDDARKCRIFLTETGWQLKGRVLPIVEEAVADAFHTISREEFAQMKDVLMRLQQNLNE